MSVRRDQGIDKYKGETAATFDGASPSSNLSPGTNRVSPRANTILDKTKTMRMAIHNKTIIGEGISTPRTITVVGRPSENKEP